MITFLFLVFVALSTSLDNNNYVVYTITETKSDNSSPNRPPLVLSSLPDLSPAMLQLLVSTAFRRLQVSIQRSVYEDDVTCNLDVLVVPPGLIEPHVVVSGNFSGMINFDFGENLETANITSTEVAKVFRSARDMVGLLNKCGYYYRNISWEFVLPKDVSRSSLVRGNVIVKYDECMESAVTETFSAQETSPLLMNSFASSSGWLFKAIPASPHIANGITITSTCAVIRYPSARVTSEMTINGNDTQNFNMVLTRAWITREMYTNITAQVTGSMDECNLSFRYTMTSGYVFTPPGSLVTWTSDPLLVYAIDTVYSQDTCDFGHELAVARKPMPIRCSRMNKLIEANKGNGWVCGEGNNGVFRWRCGPVVNKVFYADSVSLMYTNWAVGEPKVPDGCIYVENGLWYSIDCNEKKRRICTLNCTKGCMGTVVLKKTVKPSPPASPLFSNTPTPTPSVQPTPSLTPTMAPVPTAPTSNNIGVPTTKPKMGFSQQSYIKPTRGISNGVADATFIGANGEMTSAMSNRAALVSVLSQVYDCGMSEGFDIDVSSHPTQLSISEHPMGLYIGCVVGNIAVTIGGTLFIWILSTAVNAIWSFPVKYPGRHVLPIIFFLQPLSFCSARILYHGGGNGLVHILGLVGLVICCLFIGVVWKKRGSQFFSSNYNVLFGGYTAGGSWFPVFEFSSVVALGLITGYVSTSQFVCTLQLGSVAVILLSHGGMIISFRPLRSRVEAGFNVVVDAALVVGSVAIMFQGDETGLVVAENAFFVGSIVVIVFGLYTYVFDLIPSCVSFIRKVNSGEHSWESTISIPLNEDNLLAQTYKDDLIPIRRTKSVRIVEKDETELENKRTTVPTLVSPLAGTLGARSILKRRTMSESTEEEEEVARQSVTSSPRSKPISPPVVAMPPPQPQSPRASSSPRNSVQLGDSYSNIPTLKMKTASFTNPPLPPPPPIPTITPRFEL